MGLVKLVLIGGLAGIGIGMPLIGVVAAENSLHIWHRPKPEAGDADALARGTGSTWKAVEITAGDGAVLQGWLFTPRVADGSAAILLHGVSDSRKGMMGHAQYLLREGFTVLAPDLRGHGSSGGELTTYGVREAADVHRWADWLLAQGNTRLYGLGESLGAAVLLESLTVEDRFRAVVAECPFATFQEVALDRLSQESGVWRGAFWPVVESGMVYARTRYGVNLWKASPAAAIRVTRVPVLLIHGTRDTHIPVRHSEELHALNPGGTRLWEVKGSEHVEALSDQGEVYVRTVVEWFRGHR